MIKKYQDFLNERLTQDLTKISKKLKNHPYNFNKGGCGIFADLVSDKFKLNKFAFVYVDIDNFDIIQALKQNKPLPMPYHIFVKLGKDSYYDADGLKTKEGISKDYFYGNDFYVLNASKPNITDDFPEEGNLIVIVDKKLLKKTIYNVANKEVCHRNYKSVYNVHMSDEISKVID